MTRITEDTQEMVERLAYSVANAKLGEGPSVRCEGPTDYEIRIAREWVRRVLRASQLAGVVGERDALRAAAMGMRQVLVRYRTETPLGHQPHMIAHVADLAIAEFDAALSPNQGAKL